MTGGSRAGGDRAVRSAVRSRAVRNGAVRNGAVFDRAHLAGPTVEAARALLGSLLVREPTRGGAGPVRVGRIVEVEAYLGPDDEASHARFGRGGRSAVMFGPPGIAYVYLVYGMYDALNVVTGPDGQAAAVLVRAVEPLEGIDVMRDARLRHAAARRRVTDQWLAAERDRLERLAEARLASGPGLVAAAFGVDRSFTGVDLCDPASALRLARSAPVPAGAIVAGPRVGVGYAGEAWRSAPLRFAVAGSRSVSRPSVPAVTPSGPWRAPDADA